MSEYQTVVEIKNLSKVYKLYNKKIDILIDIFSTKASYICANVLSNISINIKKGEVVGIVGENGAGKSTLLKIIAKTIPYSTGIMNVKGKVAAILELGTGFHPEFSGKDNIYFVGLCIGMNRKEIDSKLSSIVEFSELGEVIEQPFRTYSSGMQARLTFSTVVHIDPDVLIVDEALSVGDARFQLKSFNKIKEFREKGKTIILVSHDHNTITEFCDRAILLHKGKVLSDGPPNLVCEIYHNLLFGGQNNNINTLSCKTITTDVKKQSREYRFGTNIAKVIDFYLTTIINAHEKIFLLYTGDKYRFCIRIIAYSNLENFCVGLVIRSPKGLDLFGIDTNYNRDNPLPKLKSGEIMELNVEIIMCLAAGVYFASVGIADFNGVKYDFCYDLLEFQVVGAPQLYTTSLVNLHEKISFSIISSEKVKEQSLGQ